MPIATPGSLASFMNALVALEQSAAAQILSESSIDMRVYRWRPNTIELPALWNWMGPSPYEQRDLSRFRDTLTILTRVGVRHTDVDEEMAQLELIADGFREVADPALASWRPLSGSATATIRRGMGMAVDRFNDVPVLCIEFSIEARMDRQISHN